MFKTLKKLIRSPSTQPLPALPAGQRVYAVGDIHGRRDLFEALIARIDADNADRGWAETTIVLLGDLVDRGPDSAGVLAAARRLGRTHQLRILCGNHEEMFLRSFDDREVFRQFLRFGGRETILSYPIDAAAWSKATLAEAHAMMRAAVPLRDLDFIRSFEDWVEMGDYLFVHAAIAPGVPLRQQSRNDLRWMREPFLSHTADHGHMVVHGHTIAKAAEFRANRIGIDTGAYITGRLTALGLESEQRWLIAAQETPAGISCEISPA